MSSTPMYLLPSGTILYRGHTQYYTQLTRDDPELPDRPFFGMNQIDVEQYGIVFSFKTITDLNLIQIDNISDDFFNSMPPKIKQILLNNYGFKSKQRNSESKPDKELVEYLCNRGYDGYSIITDMETFGGGRFHNEVAICDKTKIELIGRIDNREDAKTIQQLLDEGRARAATNNVREARLQKKKFNFNQNDEENGSAQKFS